jgi:hypothetical protein
VNAFKTARGMTANGVIDAATWEALYVPVGPELNNRRTNVVKGYQELMNRKFSPTDFSPALEVDGKYGDLSGTALNVIAWTWGYLDRNNVTKVTLRSMLQKCRGPFLPVRFLWLCVCMCGLGFCDADMPSSLSRYRASWAIRSSRVWCGCSRAGGAAARVRCWCRSCARTTRRS